MDERKIHEAAAKLRHKTWGCWYVSYEDGNAQVLENLLDEVAEFADQLRRATCTTDHDCERSGCGRW